MKRRYIHGFDVVCCIQDSGFGIINSATSLVKLSLFASHVSFQSLAPGYIYILGDGNCIGGAAAGRLTLSFGWGMGHGGLGRRVGGDVDS